MSIISEVIDSTRAIIQGMGVTLRELQMGDAKALLSLLTSDEVTRFISPPPTTLDGFERFISWTIREREAGRYCVTSRYADCLCMLTACP